MTDRSSRISLLGPGSDLLRDLLEYSIDDLRATAVKRGLSIAADVGRAEIANRLVREIIRENIDALYEKQDNAFLVVDEFYPFLVSFIQKFQPTRISEIGCGTGLLTELIQPLLPAGGRYLGSDHSDAAIVRARARLAGDDRFDFDVCDAEEAPLLDDTDCILFPWVMNWLDTYAVDRIAARLAAIRPPPVLILCVAFRACVERLRGVERDEEVEIEAAERFLRGDRAAAQEIWDVRRYQCYVESFESRFEILESHVRPGAHIFWAARARVARLTPADVRR